MLWRSRTISRTKKVFVIVMSNHISTRILRGLICNLVDYNTKAPTDRGFFRLKKGANYSITL